MKILVPDTTRFIGFHIAKRHFERDNTVVRVDNINDCCDINLKQSHLIEINMSR